MLVPGSTDSAFWSFLRFFCWGMMLHSALDCFHPVDSELRQDTCTQKQSHPGLDMLPERDYPFQMRTIQPWLYWKDNTVFLTRTGTLIPGTTQDFFFALLKFPHPEFTVGALIFIFSPPKKHKLNSCCLASTVCLSWSYSGGGKCCSAEFGLFWPLQAFKNRDILLS